MLRFIALLILFLAIVAFATGCTTTGLNISKIVYKPLDIPENLTDCTRTVKIPTGEISDAQVAKTIIRLNANIRNCEVDAKTVRKLVDEQKQIITGKVPVPKSRY